MLATAHPHGRLRVGAASIDITPAAGIRMQGYGLRRAEAITDRLLASALAVGSDAAQWLLLSVDCIGLDRHFTRRVRETLARSLSLPPSAITITCSHTHSGPATLPNLGVLEADETYLTFLQQQLTVAAEAAAQSLEDVRWRLGTASLPENVNRRIWSRGKIELGADPKGPVDSRLRVIRIDRVASSPQSTPLALIVHYACHATSSGGVPRISADWPGAMRTILQTVYGDGKPPLVCFLQGCAGDVTHRIARDRHSWPEHFGQYTSVQCDILGRLAAAAALNASERARELRADTVEAHLAAVSLPYHRHAASEETEVQVVRIGCQSARRRGVDPSIWIVALPGEPFTAYGTGIADRLHRRVGAPHDNVLVCGYSNDAVGYLCTRKALAEGGYEAAQAHEMYHRPAAFAAATQSIVFNRVSEAAIQLMDSGSVRSMPRVGLTLKRLGQMWSLRP